jgi:hypothetical protein
MSKRRATPTASAARCQTSLIRRENRKRDQRFVRTGASGALRRTGQDDDVLPNFQVICPADCHKTGRRPLPPVGGSDPEALT